MITSSFRRRDPGRKGLAALIAASAIVALPASAAQAKTRTVVCKLDLFATIPQPAATAANYGSANCAITGGTGAWRRIRGSGNIVGTSPDAKRTSLTQTLTLRGFKEPRASAPIDCARAVREPALRGRRCGRDDRAGRARHAQRPLRRAPG